MHLNKRFYWLNKIRCLDDPVPAAKKPEQGRLSGITEIMTDNQGLQYVAVRNCDLERFSAK